MIRTPCPLPRSQTTSPTMIADSTMISGQSQSTNGPSTAGAVPPVATLMATGSSPRIVTTPRIANATTLNVLAAALHTMITSHVGNRP